MANEERIKSYKVDVSNNSVNLPGTLVLPDAMEGLVIFAHGSGSSRLSPRNIQVAKTLNDAGIGTLLFDLLTPLESENRKNVFNIPFLADRLVMATNWLKDFKLFKKDTPIGYFGASTGAGAALWAASKLNHEIKAVVSRGGRPDLAIARLSSVEVPTLLIVGGDDKPVIEMNQQALKHLHHGELVIIPGATHLFEEPSTLEEAAKQAQDWFLRRFKAAREEAKKAA